MDPAGWGQPGSPGDLRGGSRQSLRSPLPPRCEAACVPPPVVQRARPMKDPVGDGSSLGTGDSQAPATPQRPGTGAPWARNHMFLVCLFPQVVGPLTPPHPTRIFFNFNGFRPIFRHGRTSPPPPKGEVNLSGYAGLKCTLEALSYSILGTICPFLRRTLLNLCGLALAGLVDNSQTALPAGAQFSKSVR